MTGTVFWAALVVGPLLISAGAVAQGMGLLGVTTAQLILCSGLGITFGAFGSTSTIKYKGVVIAGVAAIAIALLLLVDHLVREDFVYLRVDGDITGAQVELIGDRSYPGAAIRSNLYEFIVIGRSITQERLSFIVSFPPTEQGGHPREYIFDCVPKKEIEPHLGSDQKILWRFDMARGTLVGGNGHKVIAEVGPCRDAEQQPPSQIGGSLMPSILTAAYAADEVNINDLLDGLESPSTVARRDSRENLAKAGLGAVRPMLDRLGQRPASYRTRLGVVVALTEMLREIKKSQRKEMIDLLSEQDVRRLVEAATDDDRTIRVYASEFFFGLGDPRAIPVAFALMGNANDEGKYQLVVVVQGGLPYLPASEIPKARGQLQDLRAKVGPNTQTLIDRILNQ